MYDAHSPCNAVVLISGRGSNLQALLNAANPRLAYQAVVSNRAEAAGLSYAHTAAIPTHIIDHRAYVDRNQFDAALIDVIDHYQPDWVLLAGFMRILTVDFVRHYYGRLINIHPSLLPAFKGLNTHQRALDAGVTEHGASIHFVTPELDSGAIIAQAKVLIYPDDNADKLAARVLAEEHRLYPLVVDWLARGWVTLKDGTVHYEGEACLLP